ncbi:MAG: SHOCT-like domain-containing protein [Chloroflexota bacterium]
MATSEERRKILEMLAEGKISTAEAADLLGSVTTGDAEQGDEAQTAASPAVEKPATAGESGKQVARNPRWLHIRVADLKSGRRKVAVNIPLQLVKLGAQLGSGFAPELDRIDWDLLNSSLTGDEGRALVDIQDEEDGEHVQIYVD